MYPLAFDIIDKVLVTSGDVIAEYVAPTDTILDVADMTRKRVFTDSSLGYKSNSTSMIVDSSRVPDVSAATETKYKSLSEMDLDACSFKASHMPTVEIQNNLLRRDKKEMPNYTFVDFDFDFANLHLSDVMQEEKCLVSQIINHLSSSLTSNCSINNKTFHTYERNNQEESSCATSPSDKGDADAHYKYKYYQRRAKNFPCKINKNPKSKDSLKLDTPSTRRRYSSLNNSIISMSPNFNTPSHKRRERRNTYKTALTSSNICTNSVVSKSPNFTPECMKKRNLTKTSHVNSLKGKGFKKSPKYKAQMQYSEFNWHKKYIAQSTPRRKKRSIYKFHSGRKRFGPCRYESDVTSDEFTFNSILKPADLNKTIFFETAQDTTRHDILDTSSELSSLNIKKRLVIRQRNNHLAIKLDEERYDQNDVIDNNSDINFLEPSNSFNQIETENESFDNFSNNKKNGKLENDNKINADFITVRKNMFNIDNALEKKSSVASNDIKSTYATESASLHKENFVDCVDCDTKKLLNEDLNMNISKTCNLHAKNWYSDRFHVSPLYRSPVEKDSLSAVNLSVQYKKQVYLSDFQKSHSSTSVDSKKMEDLLTMRTKDSDMYKAEDNS